MPAVMIHLSQHAHRARVAAMLMEATDGDVDPLTAVTLADVLDAVSAAVLRSAGLKDEDARSVLAALWGGRAGS
jgi:hypothetical protein